MTASGSSLTLARPEGEESVLFDLPVIDAHQHFWDLRANYLPWLCDEPQIPFRYGDYGAIRRNYLPSDYAHDTQGFRVEGSVFIETEWDRRDPVGEMHWVHDLRKRTGWPSVAVCHVPLHEARAADLLAQQAEFSFVRGVRHKPRAGSSPADVQRGAPESMLDPLWQRGYARLALHDFSFDLQTPWWHLEEAVELNRAFPETRIILNHTGLPADRSPEALAGWRRALEHFASAPNVAMKISGLGERGIRWSLERNRELILQAIRIMGVDRCMFASNFPVDSLVGEFAKIYSGFIEATQPLGVRAQGQLFHDNARRIYRITGS